MANTHGSANGQVEFQRWEAQSEGSFVVSGGLPSSWVSLTLTSFATVAYIANGTQGLEYVTQAAATVGSLSGGNGLYWIACHTDVSTVPAGWTRQTGTHYLWQKSASQPAAPSGGILLASVTVSAGAITTITDYRTPRSLVMYGVYSVKDPLYGAVGDGVADDLIPLRNTFAAAKPGSCVYCPPGTYAVSASVYCTTSNLVIRGERGASIIKATAGATLNHGLLTLGYTGSATVAVSDIEVTGLTLDATSKNRAIFCLSVTRGYFHHNIWQNGASGVAYFSTVTDCEIASNYVTGAGNSDQYGDGIYTEFATNVKILYNRVHSFHRIGIVVEGDGTTKSANPLIEGNEISHAITSTAPEYNAGIWLENTNSGRILNNRMTDLYNTPSASVYGIVVSIGATGNDNLYVIRDNVIADVDYGVWVNPTTSSTVFNVEGNMVRAGTVHTSYKAGVLIAGGTTITVARNNFGANTHTADAEGSILVNATNSIFSLTVEDNQVANVTYANGNGAFNLYDNGGAATTYLNLINQKGRVIMWESAANIVVDGCSITGFSTSYYSLSATTSLRMTNSDYTGSGTLTYSIQPLAGGIYQFTNCRLTLGMTISAASATLMYLYFDNCSFGTGSFITLNSAAYMSFNHCVANEYRTFANGGFLLGNGGNYTWHLRMRNCDFISTTSEVVTKLSSFNPTSFFSQGCISPSGLGALTKGYGALIAEGNSGVDVIATASLPTGAASQNGRIIIEDNGAGDRNLILYAGGQRFRIDGGAAV